MKKIVLIALAVVLAVSVFAGCSKPKEEASAAPTQITSVEEGQEEAPAPVEEEPVVVGTPENISPTTGLENTTTTYKPVIVQIDNEGNARPQTNIQKADIVYETTIEDPATRLTCLFNDAIWSADAPSELTVGPVRSSRYYHQWIQGEWDALYVHMGGPDKTNSSKTNIWGESGEHIKQRINGAGSHAVNAGMFSALRPPQSQDDYAATDIIGDAGVYNYEPKQREPFKYYPLEDYADAQTISSITLPFLNKANYVGYEYDSEKDKLIRSMFDKEHKDSETGSALEVQNLIVQYVSVGDEANDLGRKFVDVFGEGPADFIIHGKHLKGTWERAGENDSTKYYLENGEEVILTPGNTWIEVHPNNKKTTIEYV